MEEAPVYNMSFDEPSEAPPEPDTTAMITNTAMVVADPVADEPEQEGTITIPQGKVVPLGAVQAERGKRKEAERAKAELEAQLAEVSLKAKNWDEAKTYLEQAKPYIEKARADLQRPKETAQEPEGPLSSQEAVEHAKLLDLWTTDGKPDTSRAQQAAKLYAGLAAKQTQQAIAPILQNEASRAAQSLFQQYASRPEQNGVKVDANLLAEAFNMVGPELIAANPAVAEVLYMNTIGRQLLSGQKPVSAPPPPLVSESLGPGKTPDVGLTDMDTKFMQAAQMKPSDFKETRDRYKPGQNNSLE